MGPEQYKYLGALTKLIYSHIIIPTLWHHFQPAQKLCLTQPATLALCFCFAICSLHKQSNAAGALTKKHLHKVTDLLQLDFSTKSSGKRLVKVFREGPLGALSADLSKLPDTRKLSKQVLLPFDNRPPQPFHITMYGQYNSCQSYMSVAPGTCAWICKRSVQYWFIGRQCTDTYDIDQYTYTCID